MKAPCIDCPERGCGTYHDQCSIYKKFKEEQEALLIQKIKHKEVFGIESMARGVLRNGSGKGDKGYSGPDGGPVENAGTADGSEEQECL